MGNKENKSILTWFRRVPRRFFCYPIWIFSTYFGIGYIFAGVLHYRVWMKSPQVETIFTNMGLMIYRPNPTLALLLFGFTSLVAVIIYHLLLRRIANEGGNLELAFWGTTLSLFFAWLPWLYASSIVTTLFLFLFGMNSIIGFGIIRRLLSDEKGAEKAKQADPWKMFVNAIKACAAIVAILIGAIATSVLLPWRQSIVETFEILRYTLLCAYAIIGMLAFILMPLLARILEQGPSEDVCLDPPGPL